MSRIDSVEFFEEFQKYIKEWRSLEREYYTIPNWRVFKQLRNLNKRTTLTRVYAHRMKKWGILDA